MNWIKKISFKQSIFIRLIAVSLIPLILCSFFIVKVYTVKTQYEEEKHSSQQVTMITNKLTNMFESQVIASNSLSKDDLSSIVLIDNKADEYQKELYYTLYNLQTSMQTQSSFTIYDISGYQRFSTDGKNEPDKYPIYWGIINKIRESNSREFYAADSLLSSRSQVLIQTGFPIKNSIGVRLGYIIMGLDGSNLDSLFEGSYSQNDTLVIADQNMNLIYSTNYEQAGTVLNDFKSKSFKSGYIYTSRVEPYSNFNILLRKSTPLPVDTIKSMYQTSSIIALICLLLCIFISLKIGNNLTSPISKLNSAMNMAKEGDLTVKVDTNRQDELGNLTNNFNHMTAELKEYVDNQIKAEKKLNDTRLRLFQTQLNPHFLSNTLDSIKWSAKIHDINEIASMSENLAAILRESISGNQLTTLKHELELIDNYIEIQRIRFSDSFSYEVEIPPQLEDCLVPKLLLQPIVENAILHGLSEKENGYVSVYADQVGDNININVTDNGVGMSTEITNWLNSNHIEKREGHLGLYNLDNIIKMYYGDKYGLEAVVEEGIGTTITVIIPIRKECKDA